MKKNFWELKPASAQYGRLECPSKFLRKIVKVTLQKSNYFTIYNKPCDGNGGLIKRLIVSMLKFVMIFLYSIVSKVFMVSKTVQMGAVKMNLLDFDGSCEPRRSRVYKTLALAKADL